MPNNKKKRCRDCRDEKDLLKNFYVSKIVGTAVYYGSYCKACLVKRNQKNTIARKALNYLRLWKYFEKNPCTACGEDNPLMLSLDHVGDDKTDNVSCMMGSSWRQLHAEIKKCDVLCHNCHAVKTHASLGHFVTESLRDYVTKWPENAHAYEEFE